MYDLFIIHKHVSWQVSYFPPEFEGWVTPAGGPMVDMRGKVMMSRTNYADHNIYIIDVEDMTDLELFINQVLVGKVKPFNSYEHINRERRTRTKRYNAS